MDDDSKRNEAYLRHLSKLASGEEIEVRTKPVIGRHSEPAAHGKSKPPTLLIVSGILVVVLLGLMGRALLVRPTSFPGKEVQQDANAWALSGAKSIVFKRLNGTDDVSYPQESIDSQYLGDDRWRVWGAVDIKQGDGAVEQRKWEAEIAFFPDKKTGEIGKVFLDDVLIYSN
jgi:hypothetical protein